MALTIAIDGPGGAGKTTFAESLARALGITYLNTGAMYRALGLKALREGVDPADQQPSEALSRRTDVTVIRQGDVQHVLLDGEDVTDLLTAEEVGTAASTISKHPGVRAVMVALQQAYAEAADMVLDGRDIGTRVLPNATFKFYLTADALTRAKRRHAQLAKKGKDTPLEVVYEDLIARDKQDSERAVDPMRCAEDAIELDTSALTEEQVLEKLLEIIQGGCP